MSRIAEVLAALARHEVERRTFCELAVVVSLFEAGDAAHSATVRLRDSGLVLEQLPVAAFASGLGCLPRVGDVVLVMFPRGALVSGVVLAQVYSDARRPPALAPDEFALVWPGGEPGVSLRLMGGEEPSARLEVAGEEEISLSLRQGEVRLAAAGVAVRLSHGGAGDGSVALEAGGTRVELSQDGDLRITAAGRLSLQAAEIDIKADGPVRVNGATVELN